MLPFLAAVAFQLPAYRPSAENIRVAYARADAMGRESESRSYRLRLTPNWLDGGKRFWYSVDLAEGRREFWTVDAATGAKTAAFDDARLARSMGYSAGKPPFRRIEFPAKDRMRFEYETKVWTVDLNDYTTTTEAIPQRQPPPGTRPWRQDLNPPDPRPADSPDGKWTLAIRDRNVVLGTKGSDLAPITRDGEEKGYYARVFWAPDSSRAVVVKVKTGDRGKVWLLRSSPEGGGRAQLEERVYDQPGDRVDTFTLHIVDPATGTVTPLNAEEIDYGSMPWLRWRKDGKFTYEKMDRGYGRWRLMLGDPKGNTTTALIDEDPETFFDSTASFEHYVKDTDEVITRSERTGWGQLYMTTPGGTTTPITRGNWVVREVAKVDDAKREIVFAASGMDPKEDPYYLHYYRIGFDGTGMTPLTPGLGTHRIQLSPDGETFVDTGSTVADAPVHELRRVSDGKLLASLETGDIRELKKGGWSAPETFVAKGRDGKTDIWGLVYRPRNFDRRKRYPVLEDIYAGPQDSFVPKDFATHRSMQSYAELGFIVVKIDGMGTRNRGKAFHDVCYKNLADAGFPDRILWMKALAAKYPQVDVTRVGIFGGSAGGQNSTGALLFHPEFYKVAVSSCGCHDNRMDKIWWNEQWMGKIGPHYAEQSNIDNAAKLKGRLMLMVGELDDNVPPESTYRLGDALEKAGKEFELVLLTNQRHTGGGPYGERKRRDFFVRHLLGVEPFVTN